MKLHTLAQAQEYLNQYIAQGGYKYPGDTGIKRTRYLLSLLGNPQNKLKVVHIAGTSGKGSTAYYTSKILHSLGFHVGLHISPHLVDLRERFQINNELIDEREFCQCLEEIIPFIEKVDELHLGKITYFEVCIGLVYYIFYKKKVDYAVIETGLGGLFDATNVVDAPNKIAIITRIGFDHTEILGNTLREIATQKAGIIQNKNTVITFDQGEEVMEVIKKQTKSNHAELLLIKPASYPIFLAPVGSLPSHKSGTGLPSRSKKGIFALEFDFSFLNTSLRIKLNESAEYQIENCSLALAASIFLSKRDHFNFNQKSVQDVLSQAHFKGRMDIIQLRIPNNERRNGKQHSNPISNIRYSLFTLVVDGAHNPQKMEAFTRSLKKQYPNQMFTVLLAMKSGKDYKDTIQYIAPLAKEIIITGFNIKTQQGMSGVVSEDPEKLQKTLKEMGYTNTKVVSDNKQAYEMLLKKKGICVITGSLYLVSEMYPRLSLFS